jgi:fatty acid desaturase
VILQYVIVYGSQSALAALAIALHGFGTGLLTWALVCFVPGFFALWTIMLFNYEQHVHADPWSKHNHSRNFVGWWLNFLLFNNGYHAAHHENPGTHWSKLRAAHEKIAPEIDPRLVERNMWWYWIRIYALAPFFPSLGTTQIGRAPYDPPQGEVGSLETADVDVGEAGTNAAMV